MSNDTKSREMLMESVYHSAESILRVLRGEQVKSCDSVRALLNSFNVNFPDGLNDFTKTPRKELFVVFEGLDGSGKSTIARVVAKALHGVKRTTPPKSISHLRKMFDEQPPIIRKAYYSLGNYIAAKEIHEICEEKPVFLDRYWHSTAAYALAQELDGRDVSALPPAGDPVYKWPEDLPKPDMVVFLDVDEETRGIRHARRHETTAEEDQLAKDEVFRNLVLAAYDRMTDIPIVHVDSSVQVRETVSRCLKHIKMLPATQDVQDY